MLERWVSQFKPRYSEPRSGRTWVWELSVSSRCDPPFRQSLDALSAGIKTKRFQVAPPRWGQTGLQKALWDDLKRLSGR